MVVQVDISGPIPDELGHVHFVGIGGSGMSGIARLMARRGLVVSGSDRERNYSIDALEAEGIEVFIGHEASHVEHADTLVVTSALWPDNPELVRAKERGIPVLHRSQALAWLTRGKRLIAVAGAHGKTTSTGMLVVALTQLGADPSWVNGGIVSQLGASSGAGDGDVFVIEADESDGSFLLYDPAIALVTNIDTDHLDHYGSIDAFEAAFVQFTSGAREAVVISSDNELCHAILPRIVAPSVTTFGFSAEADVRVGEVTSADGRTDTSVTESGGSSASVSLPVAGVHNAVNAVGVIAVLTRLGYPLVDAARAVAAFEGTKRRLDLHAEERGVRVYDDYAHHPTEVHAALTAARTLTAPGARVIAVQQPHLYSRTQAMADQFAHVLEQDADFTVVLDVCGAREDPVPGVTGQLLVDHYSDLSRVAYRPDWAQAAAEVARVAHEGDVVVTLGCGDVYRIIPQVVDALGEPHA